MAAQIGAGKNFKFRNVQIFKSQSLGIGSYGSVYRAKCDQLPCAAKLLHPVLVDPKQRRNLDRFEQECHFLSGIRHPHIVQYLGTCRDPKSGLPVLLMELMDDSLTNFLEKSQEPLPYHLEVNLCHDIALALAYLHSNGIIHRDLSSNNVLLIANSRAKVTDFGMSKLLDVTPQMTPLTQCPGTTAYMSPEAMGEPPVYTNKLDCFAHGVVTIQIMTRQFPDPSPASQLVKDSRSPTGMMLMPVLEPERRKLHIDRIDPNHSLLTTAIQCLCYNEKDRPSAQQLCNQLVVLKEAPHYIQSKQRGEGMGRQTQSSSADMETNDGELQRHMAGCEREIRELHEQLQEKDATVTASQQDNQRLTRDSQRLTQDNQRLTQDNQRITQDNQRLTQDNQQLGQEVREKNTQIEANERQLQDNEHIIAEFQQTLIQKEKRIRDQDETISAREREVQEQPKSKQQQKRSEARITAVDSIQLNWRQCAKAPCVMSRGSATMDGSMAFFNSYGSGIVHAYNSDKTVWSQMPDCPRRYFTLAVVKGLLTAIGGNQSYGGQSVEHTDILLSLTGDGSKRKWSEHFPPMPTTRDLPTAVYIGRTLVVAGGTTLSGSPLATVEVLNTDTLQWSAASSLPHPLDWASATICGDYLYLLGGWDQNGYANKSVFTCSLSALLQTCQSSQPQSLGARLMRSLSLGQEPRVWQKVADIPVYAIPVYKSTCTTVRGHLLAVGGCDSDGKPTTAVHKYDPVKNTWAIISRMKMPRYDSLVTILPGDKLMVVGGCTPTVIDTVEIASVT